MPEILIHFFFGLSLLVFCVIEPTRKKWSVKEEKAVRKTLDVYIKNKKVPGKEECTKCILAAGDILKYRTWRAVKFFVKNTITRESREEKKILQNL